jgi:hypothetical protein|tara:strand:- start:168 stop:770 length:603 start_codon:yes stop_codon:yes gene_type:complete
MEYIHEIPNHIDDIVCDDIISRFEAEPKKKPGQIGEGRVVKTIKNSMDFGIIPEYKHWSEVDTYLSHKITEGIKKYKTYIQNLVGEAWNSVWGEALFDKLFDTGYQIQRTDQDGFYIWHHDGNPGQHRVFACIIYLNTLTPEDGGTTDFMIGSKRISITPEKGKMLIFPSVWPYIHTGTQPVLINTKYKYIISTFICVPN